MSALPSGFPTGSRWVSQLNWAPDLATYDALAEHPDDLLVARATSGYLEYEVLLRPSWVDPNRRFRWMFGQLMERAAGLDLNLAAVVRQSQPGMGVGTGDVDHRGTHGGVVVQDVVDQLARVVGDVDHRRDPVPGNVGIEPLPPQIGDGGDKCAGRQLGHDHVGEPPGAMM